MEGQKMKKLKSCIRRGYGREAVSAATEVFMRELGFHRIELHIRPDNLSSRRLAESTVFWFECTRKNFAKENGLWLGYDVFTIIKQEKADCQ